MSPTDDRVFRSRRVVLPGGTAAASVRVSGGRVVAVEGPAADSRGLAVLDFGDAVLMPGVVDSHVHVNEPGRTEWEGFETATRAAAAGGVTTICDMPLNSVPVTTSPAAVAAKTAAADGRAFVDYALWGGLIPSNARALAPLLAEGLPGCKCFLVPSGIDEFPNVTEADLRAAMPDLARLGSVLLVHAELPGPIAAAEAAARGRDVRRYATWLETRPPAAEDEAIALLVGLAEATGCRVHVVHLSSAGALPSLRSARRRGVPVTVETCPHYLTFTAEEISDGRTEFKCAPPIRERSNRELLWEALGDGTIDMVVSDHSPCTPSLKALDRGDYVAAWGGIASLQLGLAAVWTEARRRGFTVDALAAWMCLGPARLAGLSDRKGAIAPGRDADFVVWYPDDELSVTPALLRHRHKVTPYAGRTLFGRVEATFLRGEPVFDRGAFPGPPAGRWLRTGPR